MWSAQCRCSPGDEAILISDKGTLVRIPTDQVSTQGRNTQGVRLINLTRDEHLVGMAAVDEPEGAEFDENDDEDEGSE